MSIAKHLAHLVALPTITADTIANAGAIAYVEKYLTARGMHCSMHEYNGRAALTATTGGSDRKTPLVQFSAHIDVVPGDESQFTLTEDDSKFYGRGVFDMKFAIAGYLQVVDDLFQKGTLQEYDLGIMVTTDEEASGALSGVEHLIEAGGYRPSIAILPDSAAAGWNVEKLAKGWWWVELAATGKAVHSGRAWEGESASLKLIHVLHELKSHFENHGPLTDSLNVGSIIGGEGIYNRVPDHMLAKVEIRLIDKTSYPKAEKLISSLCTAYGLTWETFKHVEPARPILDGPLATAYMHSVEKITGKQPQGKVSLGGSDALYYTQRGIPCIISCPEGGGHHSLNEWVDKKSLEQFVPILHDFLDAVARKPYPN